MLSAMSELLQFYGADQKMQEKYIILLDPKGIILGDITTLERHLNYGITLKTIKSEYRLVIFSSTRMKSDNDVKHDSSGIIPIQSGHLPLIFSLKVRKRIRQNYKHNLMAYVVGDPWDSFLEYQIVTLFQERKFPVQVQIHSEIANPDWYQANLKNWVKFYLAWYPFKKADSIRSVSEAQKSDIVRKYNLPTTKISVVHPPLNVVSNFEVSNMVRPRTIGFVGRVAKDRGTTLLIDLISSLNEVDKSFKIVIIGDGPELDDLTNALKTTLGPSRVMIKGKLNQKELNEAWAGIGVLVSLSSTESYGRTIREANAMGIPVWSTPTSGFLDLHFQTQKCGTEILNMAAKPNELLHSFNRLLESDLKCSPQQTIKDSNQKQIVTLCRSWIELIERDSRDL
jgi:glycosyltransferase involved in cell wall biosynthesis